MDINNKNQWTAITKVLILGSYHPDKAKRKLCKLKDYLKKEGFNNAGLAPDFPSPSMPGAGNVVIDSAYKMALSDFIIFLFVKEGDSYGPAMELQIGANNNFWNKELRTMILLERSFLEEQGSSQMFRDALDLISEMGIDEYKFEDDKIPLKFVKMQIYSRTKLNR
jgi:hypothetical protein